MGRRSENGALTVGCWEFNGVQGSNRLAAEVIPLLILEWLDGLKARNPRCAQALEEGGGDSGSWIRVEFD